MKWNAEFVGWKNDALPQAAEKASGLGIVITALDVMLLLSRVILLIMD